MHFIIIASGPSITPEDIEVVKRWRHEWRAVGRFVIVVNNMFRVVPWADFHVSCDQEWFEHYSEELFRIFRGEIITTHEMVRRQWRSRVQYFEAVPGCKISNRSDQVASGANGANSGFQAIGIATAMMATKITLLGFDHQHTRGKPHCHEDHPGIMRNAVWPDKWVEVMNQLAPQLEAMGVVVKNASRETALKCFERVELAECLKSSSTGCTD